MVWQINSLLFYLLITSWLTTFFITYLAQEMYGEVYQTLSPYLISRLKQM